MRLKYHKPKKIQKNNISIKSQKKHFIKTKNILFKKNNVTLKG